LSEFLKRLQERLKTQKQGLGKPTDKIRPDSHAHPEKGLNNLLAKIKSLKVPSLSIAGHQANASANIPSLSKGAIKPANVASTLTYLLMLVTIACLTYWAMRIWQTPSVPAVSTGISKGMTLYNNQDGTTAYGLFGSKPLATENILLRGVVITSKGSDGRLDGFAIFEIDGKPTGAISVGESLGKGLTLQSIGDESATLLYEGQKLDFALSKTGANSSSKNPKK
jgi:hypothetical protein